MDDVVRTMETDAARRHCMRLDDWWQVHSCCGTLCSVLKLLLYLLAAAALVLYCSSAVRPSSASFNTVFCTLGNVAATVGDFDKHTICSRWVVCVLFQKKVAWEACCAVELGCRMPLALCDALSSYVGRHCAFSSLMTSCKAAEMLCEQESEHSLLHYWSIEHLSCALGDRLLVHCSTACLMVSCSSTYSSVGSRAMKYI